MFIKILELKLQLLFKFVVVVKKASLFHCPDWRDWVLLNIIFEFSVLLDKVIVSLTHISEFITWVFCSFLSYFPGRLGSVWWRLWRVVPPGLCGCVMRDGREWGLHLHGLFPEGHRWRNDRRGGVGGECRCADNVNVRQQRAECAIVIGDCLLVIGFSLKPSDITSATAGFSAGQLALKKTWANDRTSQDAQYPG